MDVRLTFREGRRHDEEGHSRKKNVKKYPNMQKYEASILEQSVKTPLAIQAFPIRVLAHVLATPLLIQFPDNALGNTVEDGPPISH